MYILFRIKMCNELTSDEVLTCIDYCYSQEKAEKKHHDLVSVCNSLPINIEIVL